MNRVTFILPAHLASYLINCDESGYNIDDIIDIDFFIQLHKLGACLHADIENVYFSHRNDMNSLGSDVCEFTFIQL